MLRGGNKAEEDSDDFKAAMLEAPVGNDVLIVDCCVICGNGDGTGKPGGGLNKDCC